MRPRGVAADPRLAEGRAGASEGRRFGAPQRGTAGHAGAQDLGRLRAEMAPRDDEGLAGWCASPDLLGRDFFADRPNQKRICDVTGVPTDESFIYTEGVMDPWSHGI